MLLQPCSGFCGAGNQHVGGVRAKRTLPVNPQIRTPGFPAGLSDVFRRLNRIGMGGVNHHSLRSGTAPNDIRHLVLVQTAFLHRQIYSRLYAVSAVSGRGQDKHLPPAVFQKSRKRPSFLGSRKQKYVKHFYNLAVSPFFR